MTGRRFELQAGSPEHRKARGMSDAPWQAGDYTVASRGRPRLQEERELTTKRKAIVAKELNGKTRPLCMVCAKALEPQFGYGPQALTFKGWGHWGLGHFHSAVCAVKWAERAATVLDRRQDRRHEK